MRSSLLLRAGFYSFTSSFTSTMHTAFALHLMPPRPTQSYLWPEKIGPQVLTLFLHKWPVCFQQHKPTFFAEHEWRVLISIYCIISNRTHFCTRTKSFLFHLSYCFRHTCGLSQKSILPCVKTLSRCFLGSFIAHMQKQYRWLPVYANSLYTSEFTANSKELQRKWNNLSFAKCHANFEICLGLNPTIFTWYCSFAYLYGMCTQSVIIFCEVQKLQKEFRSLLLSCFHMTVSLVEVK